VSHTEQVLALGLAIPVGCVLYVFFYAAIKGFTFRQTLTVSRDAWHSMLGSIRDTGRGLWNHLRGRAGR
jgi:hypothetical protein